MEPGGAPLHHRIEPESAISHLESVGFKDIAMFDGSKRLFCIGAKNPQLINDLLINRLYHEDGVAPAEIARRINDHGHTKRNGKRWDNKQVTRLIEDYDRLYDTTSAVVDKGIEFLKALP